MKKTDEIILRYSNQYWQSCAKYLDDFLTKYSKFTYAEANDRTYLDKAVGCLMTIFMILEDVCGLTTNWNQGTVDFDNAYAATDTDIVNKNPNKGL